MNKAIAIAYRNDLPAPFLAAKGTGITAAKIIEIAALAGIPIQTNEEAVEPLFDLDIGSYIPEEYFEIVAEILALVYTLSKETGSTE